MAAKEGFEILPRASGPRGAKGGAPSFPFPLWNPKCYWDSSKPVYTLPVMHLDQVFAVLFYVIVFGSPVWIPLAIYLYHQRKNPPVRMMSIEELKAAGFSEKEAIMEQRQQRKEARDHVRTSTNALRAGIKAGHLAKRITKKLR